MQQDKGIRLYQKRVKKTYKHAGVNFREEQLACHLLELTGTEGIYARKEEMGAITVKDYIQFKK